MNKRSILISSIVLVAALSATASSLNACVPVQENRAAPSPAPSKYEGSKPRFPEFATLDEASHEVDFIAKTPKGRGKPKKIVVRDVELGEKLPRSQRPMDVHYEDFWVTEAPFKTPVDAADQLDMVMSREESSLYIREVTVGGKRALAHDPVAIPITENPDGTYSGGLKVEGASVLWADGRILYNVNSRTLGSVELIAIAESMY